MNQTGLQVHGLPDTSGRKAYARFMWEIDVDEENGVKAALIEEKKLEDNDLSGTVFEGKYYVRFLIIMKYLVKISKKARILELKRRHLKITVLTSNTPYPSRKIRCIHQGRYGVSVLALHKRPRRKQDQYAVSREDRYAVFKLWK
ncbi:hypothetical protein Tco_0213140 [Tanacetum coccineum]